ncbi:hypothetical protein [Chryseobacterium sp. EO14]|uniref:hypothetical protein n=1 Tax=Chryseobacterium sp. EO14 TaxID=2950551 RepID=UPI00210CC428|nr:hypothetical protein [Chryseobacterium sp. EO14]MCQ4139240.1 hypothetical protein [Chryseobacterium sp. EO14]
MPQLSPTTGLCIPTTGKLMEYFGKNTPEGRENDGLGFLQFLKSQANTQGAKRLSDSVRGVPGKKRGVKLMYTKPICYSICASPFNCLEERTPYSMPINVAEYEIEARYTPCDGDGSPMELTLDSAEYQQYCDLDDKSFFDELIIGYDMRFMKELNRVLVEMLLTNISTSPKTYPIIAQNQLTGQRVVNDELPIWLKELANEAKTDYSEYVIFGGQMVNLIAKKFGLKTSTAEGTQYSINDIPPLYYDRNFDTVFGKNSFVMLPKKAFQFVDWVQYEGSKAFKGEKEIYFTKNIPLGNGSFQTVDWTWEWDPKCSKWKYMPSIYAEMVKAIEGTCADDTTDGIFIVQDCNTTTIPTCQ